MIPMYFQTPPPAVISLSEELPLLPGSDPLVLDVYRWTLAHSPSLQQVVRQLAKAERKARYRLKPGLDVNYGRIVIVSTNEEYHIDIQVPILPWQRCGDALEPWIATALFLAKDMAVTGGYSETGDPHHLRFLKESKSAAFEFQKKVKAELMKVDPIRLKDLPNGLVIFERGFPSTSKTSKGNARRPLPEGIKS